MLEDLGPPPEPEAKDQMDDENEEDWETDEEMNG